MYSVERARTIHLRLVSSPQSTIGYRGYRSKATIGKLSGELILNIFLHCLDASPQFWPTLVHVCQNWRHIVFTSPLTLRLRLYCKHGTPILKTLGCWPALPIIVQYGGSPTHDPPSPEDEDNIVAALMQSDRVSSISLTITSSLLEKFSPIEEPFSNLEELTLLSRNRTGLTLPSTFKWASRLRRLYLTGISLPALSQLLSPSIDLVDLQLHEVPSVGYFSLEVFATALSGMTHLRSLSLHFLSSSSRPNHIGPSPSPEERVVLPSLSHLKFRGASEYLNCFVTRIDAPRLVDIEVRLFNQLIFHLSQLVRFIERLEMQKSHLRADIVFSRRAITISITQPEARLTLQITCGQLDWQLSSVAQICDHLAPFLSSVQDIGIDTTDWSSEKDDVDREQWLEVVRVLDCAKELRVAGEIAAGIVRAFCPVDGEHTIVLPALCNLRMPELVPIRGPLRAALESFTASRSLLRRPVHVTIPKPSLSMVPQTRYKPHTYSDRRRYVEEVNLEPSIHFYTQKPDEKGISLTDAMHGRFVHLVARDEPIFQERGPSVSIRLNWPGYQPWSRQIPTRDFRNPPGPITRAKLARHVANSVASFITEHKDRQMEEDGDLAWLVGPGKIEVSDLVLVRLDHVSKGSWQIQLATRTDSRTST